MRTGPSSLQAGKKEVQTRAARLCNALMGAPPLDHHMEEPFMEPYLSALSSSPGAGVLGS